jgi:hypothetical protein
MDLDCVTEAVAELHPQAQPDLISVAPSRCFLATDRVGLDQVEGAGKLIEEELVARLHSFRRRAARCKISLIGFPVCGMQNVAGCQTCNILRAGFRISA